MDFDVNEYINDIQSESRLPKVNYKPIFEADYESETLDVRDLKEKNEIEIEKLFESSSYINKQKQNISDLFLGLMRMSNRFAAQNWAKISILLDESINKAAIAIDSYEYCLLTRDMVPFHAIIISASTISIVPYTSDTKRCVIIVEYDFSKEEDKLQTAFAISNKNPPA